MGLVCGKLNHGGFLYLAYLYAIISSNQNKRGGPADVQVRRSILGPFRVFRTNCLLSLVQDVYVSVKDEDQDQYSA